MIINLNQQERDTANARLVRRIRELESQLAMDRENFREMTERLTIVQQQLEELRRLL